ncbi:uncharacterized protein LOC129906388 [Episyrphus balteatus]|uniref:uncharacterized protein LOC129906388 n=1 Tax=Episyrphus balteatus TaxID=286459 RepID=UPI00248623EE|nr:uncharacterized protein LOC129906388 [Episyrphus balteatus]
MFSSPVLSCFLILAIIALTYPAIAMAEGQSKVEIIAVDDISKFKNIPHGAALIPLRGQQTRGSFSYTVGQRVSNDRIVSQGADSTTWNSPQNVRLNLQYPANGIGAKITFVKIDVIQGSEQGQAYIVSGGIGQTTIVIAVEAYNVRNFSYAYNIWGM